MEENENDEIIVLTKGLNGKTVFSVYTEKKRVPILTEKNLEEFSQEFIRLYPNESGLICRFYNQICSGFFPENINISKLDPTPRENLLGEITKQFQKNKTV